jgi:MtN3 and saliva related transmembrane protein
MLIIDIIGLSGSTIIGLSFIPQTYKVIREQDVKSISINFIIINIISSLLMTIYGVYLNILPIIIANSCVLANNIVIIYYIIKLNICYHNYSESDNMIVNI